MKNLFVAMAIGLISFSALAIDVNCKVISRKYPELTKGVNKDSICDESFYALKNDKQVIAKKMVITVTGRSMHSVSLSMKVLTENNKLISQKGTLIWYPGDEYVVLD